VSNRERIALQERETAAQKGKHQNRTERIDGWRSNRVSSDVYISIETKGSRNRTRQRVSETEREQRDAYEIIEGWVSKERETRTAGVERGNKRAGAKLKQESEGKNEGWADRCFVWEERERWKRILFESQTNPSYSIKRKESGGEVVGLEK
jgi:hypothetical protein